MKEEPLEERLAKIMVTADRELLEAIKELLERNIRYDDRLRNIENMVAKLPIMSSEGVQAIKTPDFGTLIVEVRSKYNIGDMDPKLVALPSNYKSRIFQITLNKSHEESRKNKHNLEIYKSRCDLPVGKYDVAFETENLRMPFQTAEIISGLRTMLNFYYDEHRIDGP